MKSPVILGPGVIIFCFGRSLLTPGLDYTRLFISLTAGAGTRCMCLLSSSPSLLYVLFLFRLGEMKSGRHASARPGFFILSSGLPRRLVEAG